MKDEPLYREDIDEAQELMENLQQAYYDMKEWFSVNRKHVPWDYLKAYHFGHIEPYLFNDHDYVSNEESFEEIIENLEVTDDEDEEEKDED